MPVHEPDIEMWCRAEHETAGARTTSPTDDGGKMKCHRRQDHEEHHDEHMSQLLDHLH
jgi:hypothetical protein